MSMPNQIMVIAVIAAVPFWSGQLVATVGIPPRAKG